MSSLIKRGSSYVLTNRLRRVAARVPSHPGNYDHISGARLIIRDTTTTMTARGGRTWRTTQTYAALRGKWFLSGTRNERSSVRLKINPD